MVELKGIAHINQMVRDFNSSPSVYKPLLAFPGISTARLENPDGIGVKSNLISTPGARKRRQLERVRRPARSPAL